MGEIRRKEEIINKESWENMEMNYNKKKKCTRNFRQ